MINIFLSYSGNDEQAIYMIINCLRLSSDRYCLHYYHQPNKTNVSMEDIIKKLNEMDLFILFITDSSLNSSNVQKELETAIELIEKGQIKEICPIVIDNNIDTDLDSRIPQAIRGRAFRAISPIKAAQIIDSIIYKY